MIRAVLFDLDGTLMDSAPGILESFGAVFDQHGISPHHPLDNSLIGPPLRATMERLAGSEDPALIERLAASFRERYDAIGVASTEPYPAYEETLDALQAMGFALLVVTNKRIQPTLHILERHGGVSKFLGVYSPDAFDPPMANKQAVIAHALGRHALDPARSVYVGDSADDGAAAAVNRLAFIAATYGYGNPLVVDPVPAGQIPSLADLPAQLARLAL